MKKRLFWWTLAGWLFVGVMGTLLHFLYEWSGEHIAAAVISGVNESTWEHMKLLFVPAFLFSVVQICILGKLYPNYLAVRAVSVLVGLWLIPVLFYTYCGVLGKSVPWINIAIFYLVDLIMFLLDRHLLKKGSFSSPWQQVIGLLVLWGVGVLFRVVYVQTAADWFVAGSADRAVRHIKDNASGRKRCLSFTVILQLRILDGVCRGGV